MATAFAPIDYELIRKALGYDVSALPRIKRQCDRFEGLYLDNVAGIDYVGQVQDLLTRLEAVDKAIDEQRREFTYGATRIDVTGEISITRSVATAGATSADGLYSERAGIVAQLEQHLIPVGLHAQSGVILRGY
jgi:hypothetical protein